MEIEFNPLDPEEWPELHKAVRRQMDYQLTVMSPLKNLSCKTNDFLAASYRYRHTVKWAAQEMSIDDCAWFLDLVKRGLFAWGPQWKRSEP